MTANAGDPLITPTEHGLYVPGADLYIDPWRPVDRAIVTHAHADHARTGSAHYLCSPTSRALLAHRLGADTPLEVLPWGERLTHGDVSVSLHPAGHVLGSAQVRVERAGQVWVFTGDYKRAADPSCEPFELVPCDTLITEATFSLPIYRWPAGSEVAREIRDWWDDNARHGRASVLFCYALGKAQRILAELHRLFERETQPTVWLHGAVEPLVDLYRRHDIAMLPTARVSDTARGHDFSSALILAPVSAAGSTWMRRFGDHRTAFVSGWMRIRGIRRRRNFDHGFVMSDHVDWPDLLRTIDECGCTRVLCTHGRTEPLVRYLRETRGLDAVTLPTPWLRSAEGGDSEED